MIGGPPFRSMDDALAWAFGQVSKDVCSISSVYRLGQRAGFAGGALNIWERHGQAGQILGIADEVLDQHQAIYVVARYGHDRACRDEIIRRLIAMAGTGIHARRAFEKVWLSHCGVKISAAGLAKDLHAGANWRHADKFRRQASEPLIEVHDAVYRRLDPALRKRGGLMIGAA